MHKVVIHRAGGFGQLKLEEHPDPTPGPDEVLVDVEAVGVNYADCVVRMGLYKSAKEYVGWPITPGFDFAGTVRSGAMEPGTPVFGVSRFGAYSSAVVVPKNQLLVRPDFLPATEAAAFPAVHITAWYALYKLAATQPGHTVLVHSAAGGVGSALLQLARRIGARTIGVVGATHKVEVARSLGADVVIDKSKEDLWSAVDAAAPNGFDAVFDANGPETLKQGYARLAPEGRLIIYGFATMMPKRFGIPNPLQLLAGWIKIPRFSPLDLTMANKAVLGFNLSFLFHQADMLSEALTDLLVAREDGTLKPPPIRTLPLADVAEAHRALESGQTVGKLVLLP